MIIAAVAAVVVLVVILLLVRSKAKAEPEAPRFETPRELAPQKPKEPQASTAPQPSAVPQPPDASRPPTPGGGFPLAVEQEHTALMDQAPVAPPPMQVPVISIPTPIPAAEPDKPFASEMEEPEPEPPPPAPPATPKPAIEAKSPPKPAAPAKPRTPLRSYSSINDLSEPDEAPPEIKAPPPAEIKTPAPMPAAKVEPSPKPESKPELPKVEAPKVEPPKPLPKLTPPAAKPVPPPPAKISTGKMPAVKTPSAEHDFSALNDSKQNIPAAKPAPEAAKPGAAAAIAAKYMQPSNPATAELEKNDPKHAAARRLARLSVSEIKLYHEAEVTAGRESKDLWTRLQTDIGLARQTFDTRTPQEVRDRFDYLLDEIIRQLAEGDASKLGAGAPELKTDGSAAAAAPATAPVAEAKPEPKVEAKPVPAPAPTPKPETPKAEPAPAPKPAAKTAVPVNPETAELEKGDPRHAAARRLARLSVSEIKLYHEAEVTTGRENKDLWTRLSADISLATQTFEKRVDKDVRDRFDYLYDEVLRQLAEGDTAKLGPGAPTPKKVEAPSPVSAQPASGGAAAPAAAAAAAAPAPDPAPAPRTGAAAKYLTPANPATAELEKSDPRHAAARRLARLSVSEIKLYHEDEVKAGREAKDLWTRMSTDIGLATQTFEKRVDKEVRERFDYLYDEILRQLGEGDPAKLGPNAPKPNQ
jgi:Meckel syndrome type 1 protein